MSDDPRLHALLSEDTDEPVPPEHEARIRAGLAAHLAASMPATKPSARALDPDAPPAPSPSLPPAPTAPAAATTLGAWKIVGVGVAGLALAGGGFAVGRATAPERAPVVTSPSPSTSATAFGGSLARPAASAVTSTSTSTPPSTSATAFGGSLARPAASAVTSALPSTTPPTSPPTSFDREQSLLERARSALLRHDADAAEQALTACAREFPKPKHGEELDYLRILVLRERGDEAAVRDRAKAYLAKYPDGLFKSRVEALAR